MSEKRTETPAVIYPRMAGMGSAIATFGFTMEGTRLTDKLGNAGVCLMFPEFLPIASDILHVITLGHYIDHIYDQGTLWKRGEQDTTNIAQFNGLYESLLEKYYPQHTRLIQNILGFLSQAAIVENESHFLTSFDQQQIQQYRELTNAIWVRLIVSTGNYLLDGTLDPIGFVPAVNQSHLSLRTAYDDYLSGQHLEAVPDGEKNYTLYLWTMAIQNEFDKSNRQGNMRDDNPSFETPHDEYARLAIRKGVHPAVLWLSTSTVSLLLTMENFFVGEKERYSFEGRSVRDVKC